MRIYLSLVVSMLFIAACVISPHQASAQEIADEETDQPYEGFQQDLADLRDTYVIEGQIGQIHASTGKAGAAARRIFTRITFVEMSKEAVLRLLGDPETISDYGIPMGPGVDDPLVYRVCSGRGGSQWTILFQDGAVTRVEHTGIN